MVGGWKGVGGAGKAEGSDSSSNKALHYEGFGVQDGFFGIRMGTRGFLEERRHSKTDASG